MDPNFTPDYTDIVGLLKHLNSEELKDLLNSNEKSDAMIKDLKQVKDIESKKEMMIASNRSISEYNLSKKPILEDCYKQLEETHKIAISLKDSLKEKKSKLEKSQGVTSEETLLALLQAATAETEEQAEQTMNMFMKQEISLDDFLLKYLDQRRLVHLRRIKSEKLAGLLCKENSVYSTEPKKLVPPPLPPVPKKPVSGHTSNIMLPYPNNMPIVPTRSAPLPPIQPQPTIPPQPVYNFQPPFPNQDPRYRVPLPYPAPVAQPFMYYHQPRQPYYK